MVWFGAYLSEEVRQNPPLTSPAAARYLTLINYSVGKKKEKKKLSERRETAAALLRGNRQYRRDFKRFSLVLVPENLFLAFKMPKEEPKRGKIWKSKRKRDEKVDSV